MFVPLAEPRPMAKAGRPKKDQPEMTMVRISKETNKLAREAGAHFDEGIAAYVDRVVKERAIADLNEIARKRTDETEAKKKGKGGES